MTTELYTAGTGAVTCVPKWGCDCALCMKPQNFRTPCSAVLKITNGNTVQYVFLDAGRMNIMDSYNRSQVHSFIMTHFHPDHAQGLLPIRWQGGDSIPVHCVGDAHGFGDLYKNNGILNFKPVTAFESFTVLDITFTPVPLNHSVPTVGYVMTHNGSTVAYLCDTKGLPTATTDYLKALTLDMIILDCTYPERESSGHCNLADAIHIYETLNPKHMIISHIHHDFDVWLQTNPLPHPLQIAKDDQHIWTF